MAEIEEKYIIKQKEESNNERKGIEREINRERSCHALLITETFTIRYNTLQSKQRGLNKIIINQKYSTSLIGMRIFKNKYEREKCEVKEKF